MLSFGIFEMDAPTSTLSNGRVSAAPSDQPWLPSVPPASPPIDALAALSTPPPALFASALGRSLLGGALVGSLDLSSLPPVSAFDHHDSSLPPRVQRLVADRGSLSSSPTPSAQGFRARSPTTGVFDPVLDLDALVVAAGDAWGEDDLPRPFTGKRSFARVAKYAAQPSKGVRPLLLWSVAAKLWRMLTSINTTLWSADLLGFGLPSQTFIAG